MANMLSLAVIAGCFVIVLIVIIAYRSQKPKKPTTVPGLDPVTKEDGNLCDILKALNIHEFLLDLHKQFGPIASFWLGKQQIVSIASVKLFKQHQNAFDRPPIFFSISEPLFGLKSLTNVNGDDARARRALYDTFFTHNACQKYFAVFRKVANEILKEWNTMLNGEHIPMVKYMLDYTMKASLEIAFGKEIKNNKELRELRHTFDAAVEEAGRMMKEPPTKEREAAFAEEKKKIQAFAKGLLRNRKENPTQNGERLLIDVMIEYTSDEETQCSDVVTFIVGGFCATGNALAWTMYYLAKRQDCQDKVVAELERVLGDEEVDSTNLSNLKYLQQVIQESLRCANVTAITTRTQDRDIVLDGHIIPRNTPIIHALSAVLQDATVFPEPEKFDPDRFSYENSKGRSHLAFSPFGFAGKRACPGKRFAHLEITVALATILKRFKICLVEGQNILPHYGFVTSPNGEIWVIALKR